ncbi:hypothetical protein ACPB8Q_07870 [Methanocaldococcus indicus]|uniref:hypothetical protein n=1 Tax=Methanocaldococcus indicus TaxID=213231 RepID=UPI003C6CDF6C
MEFYIEIEIDDLKKYIKKVRCKCGYDFFAVGKRVVCPKCKSIIKVQEQHKNLG